jgi:hypothetical protein
MLPISIDQRGWYLQAKAKLDADLDLVILASGKAAIALRKHLRDMARKDRTGSWWNLYCMWRYPGFHKLYFLAIARGLGISIEDPKEGGLLVRMNRGIGQQPVPGGTYVIHSARTNPTELTS